MPTTKPYPLHPQPSPAARLHNPALALWLSVDPLSDKYPEVSPYVYCANNPVGLVDPDGREFGDYYDWRGKYLGADGINDGKIYFGESMSNYSVCTSYDDLYYAAYNYNRTLKTPEASTEYATVLQFGEIGHYMSSPSTGDHVQVKTYSTIENPSGTFVHSHPINVLSNGDLAAPEELSPADEETFKYFQLNLVVGQTMPAPFSKERAPKCFFYNSGAITLGKIRMRNLNAVLYDQFYRHDMLIDPFTNIDRF